MDKQELIDNERRRGNWALAAGLLAVLLVIVGQSLVISAVTGADGDAEYLVARAEASGQVMAGSAMQAVGLGLFLFPLMLLFDAAAVRSDRPMSRFRFLVMLGPLALAVSTVLVALAFDSLASDFAAGTPTSGEEADQRATDAIRESGLFGIGQGVLLAGFMSLTFGMVYSSLQAMRVGLLTRFAGTLGMAFGVFLLLGPLTGSPPVGLLGSLLFLVYVSFVATDRNLGSQPPAWATAEARPWPSPGSSQTPQPSREEQLASPEDFGAEDEDRGERPGRRGNRRKRKRKQRR